MKLKVTIAYTLPKYDGTIDEREWSQFYAADSDPIICEQASLEMFKFEYPDADITSISSAVI